MKKSRILFVMMFVVCMLIGSNCYAAWWGTPGYEWALARRLTPIKTQSQLNKDVTVDDYYNTILKYLSMKNVGYKQDVMQDFQVDGLYNGFIEGLVKDVSSYVKVDTKELSPKQYRNVAKLIDESKVLMEGYSNYLFRDDLKELNLYLDLSKYRAAMLLAENSKIEKEYKNNVLYGLRNTKHTSSLKYGIMPMCGEVTRGEFLVLIHRIMSDDATLSADAILKSLNEAGVLLGYDNSLYLQQNLKYSEMLTFFYRFEAYDFTSINEPEKTEDETKEEEVVER